MDWEFETLPFGGAAMAPEWETELERGGRGRNLARPPRAPRPVRPRPGPGPWPKPAPRPWPRPRPRPRPVAGAIWPWQPVLVDGFAMPPASAPWPGVPEDAPEDMPEDMPDDMPRGAEDAQGEAPPQVARVLRQLAAATRPRYRSLGSLDQAVRHPGAGRPGLYLIEFLVNGRPQAYSGKAANVAVRLRDHLRDIRRWGVPPAGYRVYAAFNPAYADPETLRRVEAGLHDALFRSSRGYLRNRQREF